MTHPEVAWDAAEDVKDRGETVVSTVIANGKRISDCDMVGTEERSGEGNSAENGSLDGVITDNMEGSGEVIPTANGGRNGAVADESQEENVPADHTDFEVDKEKVANLDKTSTDVDFGDGMVVDEEQELAADIEEEDLEEATDVVGEPMFRRTSLRGGPDDVCDNTGEEREEREGTASFAEDREPTPSFVEEQGGDFFDMDSEVVSTLYSAGKRGSVTIPGARTPKRTLSGGLLGTRARRSYSRQSSGNLQSLGASESWKTDNVAWGSALGTPPVLKVMGTPPVRFSPSPARERKERGSLETKTTPDSDTGKAPESAIASDSEVQGSQAGGGSGLLQRTDSQLSVSSELDACSSARTVHTPTRPWIIRSGSMATVERAVAAAQSGELRIIETFLAGGGDVDSRDSKLGMTLLGWAARKGQVEVVRLLLIKGAKVKAGDGSMRTALHRACSGCSPEVVKLLLDYGADPEARDQTRRTPLHRATRWGSAECALLLLDAGADIEARDQELARTPLHYASRSGNLDMTLMLLKNGANIEAKTIIGNTPLHLSCDRGFVGNVKLLLEWGADPLVVNEAGNLPADVPPLWVEDSVKAILRELLSKPRVTNESCDDEERPRPTTFRPRPLGAAEADEALMATMRAERAAQKDLNEVQLSSTSIPNGEQSKGLGKAASSRIPAVPTIKLPVLSNSSVRSLRRLSSGSSTHRSRSKPGEGGLPGANRAPATSSDVAFKRDASSMGGMGKMRKVQSAHLAKSRTRGACCVLQ